MRRVFFWTHLTIGLGAAVFIFVMSVTGVLLSFEKQLVGFARDAAIVAPSGASPLGVGALVDAAEAHGAAPGHTLTLSHTPGAAAQLVKSRRDVVWLDPYDGAELAEPRIVRMFDWIEGVHRRLAFAGGRNEAGAASMRAANLVFAFILVTGVVLWWPRAWRWKVVRRQIAFQSGLATPQARYFNWHHVMAFWSIIPLTAVVLSGVLISYSWASRPIYTLLGDEAASRQPATTVEARAPLTPGTARPIEALVAEIDPGWKRLSIVLPAPEDASVEFVVDNGNGIAPMTRQQFRVARDGSAVEPVDSAGGGPRFFVRFLHTGEIYGLAGQAVAALASLAAAVLVFTGVYLGVGRLRRMRARRARLARG